MQEGLLYLARHQNEDGSWGGVPKGCECPRAAAHELDVAARAWLPILIADLADESPAKRAEAERQILDLGRAAIPELSKVVSGDAEVRARIEVILEQFRQDPERGDLELTAMALLAFSGSANCQYTKDSYDGICLGTVIKKGLDWLERQMKVDGAFDRVSPRVNGMATLALTEAYAPSLEEKARKAAAYFRAIAADDSESLTWKGMVLRSARSNDLLKDVKDEIRIASEMMEARNDGWVRAAGILSGRDLRVKGYGCGMGVSPASPGVGRMLVLALDHATVSKGRFVADGWETLKEKSLPGQSRAFGSCARGSWEGEGSRRRLAETARHVLGLEGYYYPFDAR